MLYFGLRSSATYLDSLYAIRSLPDAAALTSVIGGFAFLHAIGPRTTAVSLVDVDPDALLHWRLIRALIDCSESLDQFVSLLSGGFLHVDGGSRPPRLGPRRDTARGLRGVATAELRELYDRTYGTMRIDHTTGHGYIGDATIHFTGLDLAPNHFCWHVGAGSLRDDATFHTLRSVLRDVPVTASLAPLETLDYATLAYGAPRQVVLASNCDSPLFTRRDVIFVRVVSTLDRPTRYVTWMRDGWLDGRRLDGSTRTISVASLPFAGAKQLTLSGPAPAWLDALGVPAFSGPDDPELHREYCREMLVLVGGSDDARALLSAVAPTFRRVLWVSPGRREIDDDVRMRYAQAATDVPQATYFELRALRDGLLA